MGKKWPLNDLPFGKQHLYPGAIENTMPKAYRQEQTLSDVGMGRYVIDYPEQYGFSHRLPAGRPGNISPCEIKTVEIFSQTVGIIG